MPQKPTNSNPGKPIIQGLWIGNELTRFEYNSIKSYLNQGYQYHLYTYWPVKNIPAGTQIKDAREILPETQIFRHGDPITGLIAPFSDLFRYKLLYDRGGVWTDCDIICVRPLPNLDLDKDYIFVSERTILKGAFNSCLKRPPYTCQPRKVLNSFIMAPKGAPIMLEMYQRCLAELSRNPGRYPVYQPTVGKSKTAKNHTRNNTLGKTQKKQQNPQNLGLKSYHWPGGSKLLSTMINKFGLTKYITDPVFAFPINWWDFRFIFQEVSGDIIPASRGWTEPTHLGQIFTNPATSLVVIHNGWIKNQGLDKNARYPPNSFFERIDRFVNSSPLLR